MAATAGNYAAGIRHARVDRARGSAWGVGSVVRRYRRHRERRDRGGKDEPNPGGHVSSTRIRAWRRHDAGRIGIAPAAAPAGLVARSTVTG